MDSKASAKKKSVFPTLLDRLLRRLFEWKVIENSCGDPYLVRYYVTRRSRVDEHGGVYLHHILRSDEDSDLHDHPFDFTSVLLTGGYEEVLPASRGETENYVVRVNEVILRRIFSVIRHAAADAHRLVLTRPVWTLVFRSPKRREWGFHTDRGWVHWREFCYGDDGKFTHAAEDC